MRVRQVFPDRLEQSEHSKCFAHVALSTLLEAFVLECPHVNATLTTQCVYQPPAVQRRLPLIMYSIASLCV